MSDQKGVLKVAYENVCVCQLKEEVRTCKLENKIVYRAADLVTRAQHFRAQPLWKK